MKTTFALFVAVLILLLLPACDIARARENSEKAVEAANEAKTIVTAADKNADGKIGGVGEIGDLVLKLAALGLGVWATISGGKAAVAAASAHKRIDGKGEEINELYDATHAPVPPKP